MAFADALRALNTLIQPSARTAKRRERAAMLSELPGLNRARLDDILSRHGLAF